MTPEVLAAAGHVIGFIDAARESGHNLTELTLSAETLAHHILASRSQEPITEEWLRSLGFKEVPSDMGPNYANHFEIGEPTPLNLWRFNDTDDWLISGLDSFPLRTQADVLNLLSALGVKGGGA